MVEYIDKGFIYLFLDTGTHEQTLEGHAETVVAPVACGQRLIGSSADKTVRVWSMATLGMRADGAGLPSMDSGLSSS